MTHHTHPYAKVRRLTIPGVDRRRNRRARRTVGQHIARLRQFADQELA